MIDPLTKQGVRPILARSASEGSASLACVSGYRGSTACHPLRRESRIQKPLVRKRFMSPALMPTEGHPHASLLPPCLHTHRITGRCRRHRTPDRAALAGSAEGAAGGALVKAG